MSILDKKLVEVAKLTIFSKSAAKIRIHTAKTCQYVKKMQKKQENNMICY
jgi:hypothetical protein